MGSFVSLEPFSLEMDRNHYSRTGFSYNRFLREALEVGHDYEKFDALLGRFLSYGRVERAMVRDIFVSLFSYAIPAPATIRLLYLAWQAHVLRYPTAKLVDLGCGTGLFLWLLHRAGVAEDRLVGIDLPLDKTPQHERSYWDAIIRDGSYVIKPEDFLLVTWLDSSLGWLDIKSYLILGGTCLAIIGEATGDATYPWDAFLYDKSIDVEYYEVEPSAYTLSLEGLSFNRPRR